MSEQASPNLSITEQMSHSTVRIKTNTGTGTGFFYRFAVRGTWHVPAIVTNNHVIEGSSVGQFLISRLNEDMSPKPPWVSSFGHKFYDAA